MSRCLVYRMYKHSTVEKALCHQGVLVGTEMEVQPEEHHMEVHLVDVVHQVLDNHMGQDHVMVNHNVHMALGHLGV